VGSAIDRSRLTRLDGRRHTEGPMRLGRFGIVFIFTSLGGNQGCVRKREKGGRNAARKPVHEDIDKGNEQHSRTERKDRYHVKLYEFSMFPSQLLALASEDSRRNRGRLRHSAVNQKSESNAAISTPCRTSETKSGNQIPVSTNTKRAKCKIGARLLWARKTRARLRLGQNSVRFGVRTGKNPHARSGGAQVFCVIYPRVWIYARRH